MEERTENKKTSLLAENSVKPQLKSEGIQRNWQWKPEKTATWRGSKNKIQHSPWRRMPICGNISK